METSFHNNEVLTAGLPLDKASKALILVHGRGGTAADILQLQQHLLLKDFAIFAPRLPRTPGIHIVFWHRQLKMNHGLLRLSAALAG